MRVDRLAFPFRLMFHPFQGFWDLKYENKGSRKIAIALLLMLAIVFTVKKQYTGFLVNPNDLRKLSSLDELKYVVLPFFLWCIANWSLTTLMEGEGKFSEIVTVTAYSLMPMIVLYLPLTAVSHFITLEESAFYYFFDTLGTFWFIWLLFIGTMTVHQYSVRKTIATMLLTLIVIGIMIFLGLLVFSLVQQMFSFVYTIYQELTFRV